MVSPFSPSELIHRGVHLILHSLFAVLRSEVRADIRHQCTSHSGARIRGSGNLGAEVPPTRRPGAGPYTLHRDVTSFVPGLHEPGRSGSRPRRDLCSEARRTQRGSGEVERCRQHVAAFDVDAAARMPNPALATTIASWNPGIGTKESADVTVEIVPACYDNQCPMCTNRLRPVRSVKLIGSVG
jgi:hypothetical protein